MDFNFNEEEKVPAKLTPAWLKRTLIVLLFVFSAAGFASSTFLFKKAVSLLPKLSGQPFKIDTTEHKNFSLLAEKKDASRWDFPKDAITCQGTIVHESGKALALINGKVIPVDGVVNGFRILEITASNVLIECDGETHRIVPGKSFTPEKK